MGTQPVAQEQPAQLPAPVQQAQLYHTPEAERFHMEQRMAKVFVASGLFSDIKGQSVEQAMAQAYVKIALGGSMGFSPAESMQGIDIIQGRPAISAQLRAARMQRAGFSWAPTVTSRGAWLAMYLHSKPIMVPRVDPATGQIARDKDGSPILEHAIASYTEEDAKLAKLFDKDNWKKDPSAMFFARAVTRAQRRFAPGVLSGDIMTREEAFDAEPDAFGPVELKIPQPLPEPVNLSSQQQTTVEGTATAIVEPDKAPEAKKPDAGRQSLLDALEKLAHNLGNDEFYRRLGAGPDSYGDVSTIPTGKLAAAVKAVQTDKW